MSMECRPPYTPLLYSKSGVYRGIHYFLIFALKHILWVLVRTAEAVLTCTHNICFEQKYENRQTISTENCHFYINEKSLYIAWMCFRIINLSSDSEISGNESQTKYNVIPSFNKAVSPKTDIKSKWGLISKNLLRTWVLYFLISHNMSADLKGPKIK